MPLNMDSLTSLAHNHCQQQHQQHVEDEFDEIVPMQLDQPPPPAAVVEPPPQRTVSFFTPSNEQQQQSFYPTCTPVPAPPASHHHHLPPHHNLRQHPSSQQFSPHQQFVPHHQRQQQRSQPTMVEHFAGHQQQQPHGFEVQQQHPHFPGHPPPQHHHRPWPPPFSQQQQHHSPHQQQQQQWQMPLRKESMPALHFNDQPFQASSNAMGGGDGATGLTSQDESARMLERTERTRSMSTAMLFCSPSPSSTHFSPSYYAPPGSHSPLSMNGERQQHQHNQDHRRTKSTVLPPSSGPGWRPANSSNCSNSNAVHSLRRFHSQLRSPCRSMLVGPTPSDLKYTPPPILSPMRQGTGLFSRILAQKERKKSSLAIGAGIINNTLEEALEEQQQQQHHQQMIIKEELKDGDEGVGGGIETMAAEEEDEEQNNNNNKHINGGGHHLLQMMSPSALQNGGGTPNGKQQQFDGFATAQMTDSSAESPTEEKPQRKNGTILFAAAEGPSSSGLTLGELEQLRKQSSASHRSHKASMFGGRMSIMHGKLSVANEDFLRKISSFSMEDQEQPVAGEDGGEKPPESAEIPHINLGRQYQARVNKWSDRAISAEERAAIPDRDEQMFCSQSIEHIPQQALAAYETLACSVALPKPGRNKELALHILAENQGNLQAAVMDLLRCDTLDWEQYPAVYNSRYVDVDAWSPEEISSFQDAIYKSEKDFLQVASELGNRTVHECVAFYYTWKKACPDDYRKLRNLRRKRQLLEQQLDLNSFDQQRQPCQSEKSKEGPTSEEEDEAEEDDFSGTESDITNPSLLGSLSQAMDCSPGRDSHQLPPTIDPLAALLAPAHQQQQPLFNGASTGYPWLHGTDGIFPSPTSSSTSTNNNDNNHNNGGGGHFVGNGSQQDAHGGLLEGGENGGGVPHHGFITKIRHHHHHNGHAGTKKGAQPQADGFFHCRLCEKRFEKVKSLNAHMKSHAMKARAEAEAQQKQQSHQHPQQQLIFPMPTKKEPPPLVQESVAATNPLGALAAPLAMPGLPNAQAAMAALNNLGRQIQQQQQQGQQPFGANTGFGLLRNMLQYGQQQAPGATPTTGTGWPPGLEQHFNA